MSKLTGEATKLECFLPETIEPTNRTVQVAFQGEHGAFGEMAAKNYFAGQEAAGLYPYRSFQDVFQAVAVGDVTYGVVPGENSQTGSILEVYDLLCRHNLFVVGEIYQRIDHCLLCLPGQQIGDIKRVISHPQALAQCAQFLSTLDVEKIAVYNTAGAAKEIVERNLTDVAAIGSVSAARLYNLEILSAGMQDSPNNCTRFFVLGRELVMPDKSAAKIALALQVRHQPGALYASLETLAKNNINILKLETRPSLLREWEYIFYLELAGCIYDGQMQQVLFELARTTVFCKVIGAFHTKHADGC